MLLVDDAARLGLDGATEDAERLAREALATAEASADDEAISVAALTLGGMLHFRGHLEEALALLARAEEAGGRAGDVSTRIRARGQRAMIAADTGDLDTADRLYRSALEQAGASGARVAEEESRLGLAGLLVRRGLWKEARAEYAAAERMALEDARPRGAVLSLTNLALLDGLAGRPRAARRQAIRALGLARAFAPRLASAAWRARATAHRAAGQWRAAERAARRAIAAAHRVGREADAAWASVELSRVMAARGRWGEAGDVCAAGSARPGGGDDPAVAVLHAWSGRAAVRAGRLESARRSLSHAVRMLGRQPSPYAALHAELLRAEIQLASGQTSDGLATARRCLSGFSSLGAPPDRAHAALELGRLAAQLPAGPDPAAASWLEEAAAAFERLGDHRSREQALAALVECQRQARPQPDLRLSDRGLIEAVSRLLCSLSDPREVAQRSMEMAVEQLGAERGVLLLAEPETGRLVPIAEHGAVDAALRSEAMGYSRRVVEQVADTGGSLLVTDAPSDPRMSSDSVVGLRLRSIVCVPMYTGGRVVGAVYLDDSRRSELFSESDRSLLEGFAHLMAVAIEKSRGHNEVERANEQLVGENLSLRQEVALRFQTDALIGFSTAMQRVLATVERASLAGASVLVTGENGTGKELIARVLHHSGKRCLGPFVTVNCGAIPQTLLESELFGILPNVATGVRGRDGRFVQADGGTLFLDEVGEMPLDQQVALLSVLANREVTPVGGGRPIPVDVRVVAATNRDLRQAIEERKFREDLYYRLSVIPIELPPLRERKADIPALAHRFATMFARQQERDVPQLSSEFVAVLMQSDWPGNVRELQNYIERVMVMTPGAVLHPRPLPRDLERGARSAPGPRRRLSDAVAELATRMLRDALQRTGGNQTRAARELGLTEQSLRYRLRKLGVLPTRRKRRTRRK
jgi:transcriptional regulator with GAF, ATPase, and Fis domain/tetratricopeptide (TPR) repeat protein